MSENNIQEPLANDSSAVVTGVKRSAEGMANLRAFSYGGGVQSTAVLVLTAQGKLSYDAFLFANVGDDSEHPKTLNYVRLYAMPYAKINGIQLIELRRKMRDGRTESLIDRLNRTESSISIPVRMSNGAPGNRTCTQNFKIEVVAKWLKQQGATKKYPATIGIGISMDEIHRMRTDSKIAYEVKEHPLIDMRLTRSDCVKIIQSAGLPVPPKSACYFCPFHRMTEWQRMKREEPELFEKSVKLEEFINKRRRRLGKDDVWLTRFARPLDQVVDTSQEQFMFGEALDNCETGYCMT